jgi:metal-responsive CopG/Arc/MetJ family transcriptional regulator
VKTKKVSVSLPPPLCAALDDLARSDDRSRSEMARLLLSGALERHRRATVPRRARLLEFRQLRLLDPPGSDH